MYFALYDTSPTRIYPMSSGVARRWQVRVTRASFILSYRFPCIFLWHTLSLVLNSFENLYRVCTTAPNADFKAWNFSSVGIATSCKPVAAIHIFPTMGQGWLVTPEIKGVIRACRESQVTIVGKEQGMYGGSCVCDNLPEPEKHEEAQWVGEQTNMEKKRLKFKDKQTQSKRHSTLAMPEVEESGGGWVIEFWDTSKHFVCGGEWWRKMVRIFAFKAS